MRLMLFSKILAKVFGKVGADSSEGKAGSWNFRTIGTTVCNLGAVSPKVWTESRDSGVS